MFFKRNTLGVTLIELLVVISIIVTVSIISAMSFSSSQDSIMAKNAIEVLMVKINEAKSQILTEQLSSSEFVFSANNPRLFYYYNNYNLSSINQQNLANNFYVDHASLKQATQETMGEITLKWTNPTPSSRLNIIAIANDKIIKNDCILDSVNSFSPACAAIESISIKGLNEAQIYEFQIQNMVSKTTNTKIFLHYLLPINLRNDDLSMRISKIELQNFSGDWIEVETASLKIQTPFTTKKYYVGTPNDSNRIEYKKIRLTFDKRGYSISQEL